MESPGIGLVLGQTRIYDWRNSGSGDRSHLQRNWGEGTQEALGEERTEAGGMSCPCPGSSHTHGMDFRVMKIIHLHLICTGFEFQKIQHVVSRKVEYEEDKKHNCPGPRGSM